MFTSDDGEDDEDDDGEDDGMEQDTGRKYSLRTKRAQPLRLVYGRQKTTKLNMKLFFSVANTTVVSDKKRQTRNYTVLKKALIVLG